MMLFLVLAIATAKSTTMSQSIIDECWKGNSHVEMSECVSIRALSARSDLESTEKRIRTALIARKDNALLAAFDSTLDSYRSYRSRQCRFQEVVAAKGNGAMDLRSACEAELDIERKEQLDRFYGWLNP